MAEILRYMLGNPHRLPQGYTPLAYIESTGTLYIDSGITPNCNKLQITFRAQITSDVYSNFFGAVGDNSNGGRAGIHIWTNPSNSANMLYIQSGDSIQCSVNKSHTFDIYLNLQQNTSSTIRINDVIGTLNSPDLLLNNNILVFASNLGTSSAVVNGRGSFKMYSFRIFKDLVLVSELIPAKRNSDEVIGMFDIVSQTFFTNSGTGSFIAGPEVVVLPYEYLQVEYIGNQYINNNLIPCYRRSDLLSGIYDITNNTFLTSSGTLGPVVEESSRQLEYNNAEQPNHFTNWRTASNWTSDGATVTLAGSYVQIAFSGGGNNRSYILSNNLWTTVGAKYLVSGWIRTTSGTSTVRFSRQIADYGDIDISANTNWTNFSTVITTTATSKTGSLSIQGTANTTIQLDNFKVIPITNSYTAYKGIPYNVHYSISNPANNLVNYGSGKFVRSEKSMITTEALGISGDANFSICAWVKTDDVVNDYIGVVANSTYTFGKCFGLLLYANKPDLDFWTDGGNDDGSRFIAKDAISSGEWHHIVATKAAGAPSDSKCKLYVDGVAVSGTVVGSQPPSITNSPIIIGRLNDNEKRYFNGEIYDVRIYNNVLTADEVLNIYKKGV